MNLLISILTRPHLCNSLTWETPLQCTIKDAGIPCTQCRVHGRSCQVNESKDKRRKAEQKRTEELLRIYKSLSCL
ncbi:uncharacterized protein BO72DRAFT_448103, partial [Aspergillus fijiensis CBS 313.89]